MSDLGGGVYLMPADSDAWEPDDDVGGLMQVLFEEGETAGGLWKPGEQTTVEGNRLPAGETVVVLQGTVRIEIEDGPTLELTSGDLASLPKGANTNWYPSRDFIKVWLSS